MNAEEIVSGRVRVLYEDEHYMFVSKPSGLSTLASDQRRAGGLDQLIHLEKGVSLRRLASLPRAASGFVGFAKSTMALKMFQSLRSKSRLRCTFLAVCRGVYKAHRAEKTGGRMVAGERVGTGKQSSRGESGIVSKGELGRLGKSAKTSKSGKSGNIAGVSKELWRGGSPVLEAIREEPRRTLVRVVCGDPTGRTARSTMLAARLPVVGDADNDPRRQGETRGRMWLHLEEVVFDHPVTREAVRVWVKTPQAFGTVAKEKDVLDHALDCALSARLTVVGDAGSEVYRLVDGRRDGIPGLVADRYGPVVVVQTDQGKFEGGVERVQRVGQWFCREIGVESVYWKHSAKDRGRADAAIVKQMTDPKPVWGKVAEEELKVVENGLSYLIRPYDGGMVGLFVDQRANRAWIRGISKGKRVLNTFSHTCGFSVAAAAGGASFVASVDVSKKSLAWGKRNFEANGLSMEGHKFYCSDVFDFYARAKRQGLKFDVVILDPPTFARSGKTVFQVEKDMGRLISGAVSLLDGEGTLLVCTNHHALSVAWLKEQVVARASRARVRFLEGAEDQADIVDTRSSTKSTYVSIGGVSKEKDGGVRKEEDGEVRKEEESDRSD